MLVYVHYFVQFDILVHDTASAFQLTPGDLDIIRFWIFLKCRFIRPLLTLLK